MAESGSALDRYGARGCASCLLDSLRVQDYD